MTGKVLNCGLEATSNVSSLLAFLMTLQAAVLTSEFGGNSTNFDPKTYVDLPLKDPLNETEKAFSILERTSNGIIPNATLQTFTADYLDPAGSELVAHKPSDYTARPSGFLSNVQNEAILNWAYQVHEIWPNLSRRESWQVSARPDRNTMVSLKNPFVVPGSRFREVYYWDSYWVIRGLLVSKMLVTARGMVHNLLSMVETYGFVPNGARKYYLNRSQPPLLSEMVKSVVEATGDSTLVEKALPILIKEHTFWTTSPHVVQIEDTTTGKTHSLARYFAKWDTPRPESYTIDIEVAVHVPESKRPQLYNDIASTAETGWDFSSRWMEDPYNLSSLRTTKIIPADLNAFLYQMEKNIELLAKLAGEANTRRAFAKIAEDRRAAIDAVLWNETTKQWNDYWLPQNFCDGQSAVVKLDRYCQNNLVYASNFVPLWCGLLPNDKVAGLVAALKTSGLLQPAGIATSLLETGQQWDFPNGWAPLQHMIIEGLYHSQYRAAKHLAEDIAGRWLKTNYATFLGTGAMQEKFDVRLCGASGGGGEYANQAGFGWTNGVALALLDLFGWPFDRDVTCPSNG